MVQMFLTGEVLYAVVVVLTTVHWEVITNFSPNRFYVKYEHFTS